MVCNVLAILSILVLIAFIPYVWYRITTNIHNLEDEAVKARYGCFYEDYNVEGYAKWTSIVFLLIRLASITGVVYGNKTPYAQIGSFFTVNLLAVAWTIVIRPHKSIFTLIGAIFTDLSAVISSCIYFVLCDPDLSEETVESLGDAVFYLYLSVSCINIGAGFIKSGYEFYLFLKTGKSAAVAEAYALGKSNATDMTKTMELK